MVAGTDCKRIVIDLVDFSAAVRSRTPARVGVALDTKAVAVLVELLLILDTDQVGHVFVLKCEGALVLHAAEAGHLAALDRSRQVFLGACSTELVTALQSEHGAYNYLALKADTAYWFALTYFVDISSV